jgi:transposase
VSEKEKELLDQLSAEREKAAQLQKECESLQKQMEALRAEMRAMAYSVYGRKSERMDSDHNQLVLEGFEQDETAVMDSDQEAKLREAAIRESQPKKKSRSKPQVKKGVPVKEERIRLEPEERDCPECGAAKTVIRVEETEELDFVPAHVLRRVYERPVCACPKCQEYVSQAKLPPRPIDKSVAGPGLLSHIIVGKYQDHCPLYRQEQIFARHGLEISRATMNNWLEHCAEWAQPVCEAQLEEILASGYIQIDETPVKLLDPERPGKARDAWLWVILNPDIGAYFHFATGRGAREIRPLLKDYTGVLQSDGYSAYESLYNGKDAFDPEQVLHVGCWAHARREFWKAVKVGQSEKAGEVVALIQKLYRIEKVAKTLGNADRVAMRQIKAKPVLDEIKDMISGYLNDPSVTPAQQLSKACSYTLKRWDALNAYLHNGHVRIDNNPVENKIRPAALGRKNWMFVGHPSAGWRTGVFYTIMANCALHDLNPFEYWRDFLRDRPAAKEENIATFLPANRCPVKEQDP